MLPKSKHSTHFSKTLLGSISNNKHRHVAANLLRQGEVVGLYNRGVNALIVDAENEEAVDKLVAIKGEERSKKPLALCMDFESIKYMIDLAKLEKNAREFLELTEDLKSVFGSLCFLRLPLKNAYKYALPACAIAKDEKGMLWIQNWDPDGHSNTYELLKSAKRLGVQFPGITSMNFSGEPEIVDQSEAEVFCRKNEILCYLRDDRSHKGLTGSYTIITFDGSGIELTRDGNIPGKVLQPIVGLPLLTDKTKPAKYAQLEFPDKLIDGLNPRQIRLAILLYLEGKHPEKINKKLRKL